MPEQLHAKTPTPEDEAREAGATSQSYGKPQR